nr:hypothetical protein [Legionellales bacterium]
MQKLRVLRFMQVSVRKLVLRIFGLSIFLSWTLLMWGQPITTELSRSPVGLGETFQIIYTLEGEVSHATPNFSSLRKDFNVLGTGKSFQAITNRGETRRITQWKIHVSAKHTGDLLIPAIAFGEQTSEAVRLEVLDNQQLADQGQSPEVFMEVSVEAEHPYVQSQVIYSVRIYTATDVVNAQLSLPEANKGVFIPLGDDWQYTAQRYGQPYQVVERRYAMFPEASGDLTIYAPTFHGISVTSGPAFSDPFFDKIFAAPFQVQGPNADLKVLPIPVAYSAKQWLPARQVQLQESWEKPKQGVRVGEPITRMITLQAEGVTIAQLPTLEATEPDGVNVYPNKPIVANKLSDGNILAEKIQNFVYIPSATGEITLPEVQVDWWNVKTQQMEQTKLPALQLTVLPAVQTKTMDQTLPVEKPAPSKPITLGDAAASEHAPVVTMATPAMPINAWPWQLPWLVASSFALL